MKELFIDKKGLGNIKGPVIYCQEGNTIRPVVYLRKPRTCTNEEFKKIIDSILIYYKKDE